MSRLLLLLLTLLIVLNAPIVNGFKNFHFVNNHRISPLKCPCEDASLCQSIPRAKGHTKLAYATNPSNWKYYELSKITEMALTYDVSKMDPQLICAAHKNNTQLHLMVTLSNETFMNDTKTGEWIEDQLDLLKENYLDGIDIDYEVPRKAEWIPHIVNLVGNLSVRMKLASPNYQLTYCIFGDPSNNPEVFNSIIIPTVIDYFMLMAYDDGFSIDKDECYATANQSPGPTINGLEEYLKRGIPPSQLVVGMPWYGFVYRCMNLTDDGRCSLRVCNEYISANESDIHRVYYDYIKNESYYMTEKGWDYATLSPFITITHKSDNKKEEELKQFWYDDGYSLRKKSNIYKVYKIRGVGAFQVDCADYTTPELQEATKQYWDFFTVFD